MHGLHHLTLEDIDTVIKHLETRTDDHDRSFWFELTFEQRDELTALAWFGSHQCMHDFDHHRDHIVKGKEYTISHTLLRSGLDRLQHEMPYV